MRLLLDTHILLALTHQRLSTLDRRIHLAVRDAGNVSFVSIGSLWEIAIKSRLGKLDPGAPLQDLASYFVSVGLQLLVIDERHAVAAVEPEPPTRDPFDRLLLAQCLVEDLRLVTLDRALAAHPLAWRPE